MMRRQLRRHLKKLMATLYCNQLLQKKSTLESLAEQLSMRNEHVQQLCREARAFELISRNDSEYSLTEKGRSSIKVVMAGGVFNIIHPGHIHTLKSAKELGDVLVVSIATDKTVRTARGGDPLTPQLERVQLVNSVKHVDLAVLGSERDIFDTVMQVKPDIIALGYDQRHREKALEDEARKRGLSIEIVRLSSPIPELKSSKIIAEGDVVREF